MAKSSEPWEHKLGGLANKGETQFHADVQDSDHNYNNDGDVAKDYDDDVKAVGRWEKKVLLDKQRSGPGKQTEGVRGCKIFFRDLEQTFTRKKDVVE